jgi:hypothetical protein
MQILYKMFIYAKVKLNARYLLAQSVDKVPLQRNGKTPAIR